VKNDAFIEATEFDAETGENVRKLKLIKPIPLDVSGFLRSAFLDIKHSFDQSLFAAAQSAGCARFRKNYPWANTPDGVKGIIESRQTDKHSALPGFLIDEVLRQEPYATGEGFAGGNDLIREIAKMVNDKHTVGFRVSASVSRTIMRNVSIRGPVSSPMSGWDPVKEELVLARMKPGSSFSYQECSLSVQILFKSAGDIGKVSAIPAAKQFADRAQVALNGFKALYA
jgi:hypothetical protein